MLFTPNPFPLTPPQPSLLRTNPREPRADGVVFIFLVLLYYRCRQALKQYDLRNARGLFVQESSESDILWIVKSLEKRNKVPTELPAKLMPPPSQAWLVSRLHAVHSWDSGHVGGGGGIMDGDDAEGVGPHVLASTLVYFLRLLPEPLLTFDKREAFLSCAVRRPRLLFVFFLFYFCFF